MSTDYALPLRGKLAVVTGSSRGIGEAIAMELARRGASVVLGYASPSSATKVQQLADKIRALPHGPSAHPCCADLGTTDGARAMVAELVERSRAQGDSEFRVDILVNNAGARVVKPLGEITIEDYDTSYNVNVRGTLLLTQAVLPHLSAYGRVINIGSVGSRAGFAAMGLYCSSKAALEGLTRCWAAELGSNGTTVNCVNPGPVPSEMLDGVPPAIVAAQKASTPIQNRLGTPEEIAGVVAALAGKDGAWISGQVISASGGWAMY